MTDSRERLPGSVLGMDRFNEFKKAYDDHGPSQDNEGYCPDRGSFKSGFFAAWDLLSTAIQVTSPSSEKGPEPAVPRLKADSGAVEHSVVSGEVRGSSPRGTTISQASKGTKKDG